MENKLKWLLTLVPWTLQRLLRQEFEVTCDTDGTPEALEMDQRYGPTTEKMEEDLKRSRTLGPAWRTCRL